MLFSIAATALQTEEYKVPQILSTNKGNYVLAIHVCEKCFVFV